MNTKLKITAAVVLSALAVVGCGRIETGEVGIRTNFNKKVELDEVPQGFYFAVFSSVNHHSIKEIAIDINDLTPKAKDNLSLKDFDVTIYYKVDPTNVADLFVSYQSLEARDKDTGTYLPGFKLVYNIARGAVYDVIAGYDSLVIHTQRDKVEQGIKEKIQRELDEAKKGTFTVTRVVVRQVLTDPSIEEAIKQSVAIEKQIEAKNKEKALATAEAARKREEAQGVADYNRKVAESLTPQLLQFKQLEVQEKFAGQGTHTVIMPTDTKALINVGK